MTLVNEIEWLAPHWQRLTGHIQSARVPQALLIVGRDGVGKARLAETFAQRLLCRTPNEYACGTCHSCRLFAAQTHPDFLRIQPEEPGKAIPVDAIRALIADLSLKPQYSGRRVVLIGMAHQLNVSSANSLLKTLEEPDEHTTLVLLTDSPQSLPADDSKPVPAHGHPDTRTPAGAGLVGEARARRQCQDVAGLGAWRSDQGARHGK